ncbi:glycerophosphodiester phosphodiesterase family protein [Xanthomonas rydalmerensis]|uniref:Glycerophosphodiester phosphodiesterase family protein n=1 Tax=Xanthomonas rydalmerensis TaxID=3046274 RepID=A0ABZ0JP29_9XANT|nr:glycerophosphodiester phosphodiesterase family protein [Xanthomonas sp. DM-2023]WOS40830.1 glycerophosphodiester phosphodiesterase family protein [Xanthomonas sp. DM-2023]WOS45014.1 glycerophosphodiester phosphodiesterase family protein [Xanthomonas sp. DM-2023]WOS49194.1 glycerophosphodiester phosphodiesterase family protein [Xanthomonas sp. DM-2023]WOS53374.1 glycerophosphodiester phosphodiesterase family protein [Xanthomonas sp. DM-2023]WOS57557.1 glycerophosphodiester phosphodiesterase 
MKIAFVPSPLARACRVLGALVTLAVVPQLAMANCNDTVGTKMSNILFGDSSGDSVVLAHRGLWGKYGNFPDMPENSRGSLQLANDQCMDGVELDIKMTSDGVPVVLHDWNLGRTTNVWTSRAGETKYDPMSNQGYNPSITVTPWSVVSGLFLLTPDRRTTTGYHVPRVDELFSYFKQHGLKTPIVFDIKDAASVRAVSRAADAAFSVGASNFVAAKVNATLYPSRSAFRADTTSMVGIPVFTTNMLTKINVDNAISAWSDTKEAMEINVKQLGGLLQGQADRVRERGVRVGVFQAIPDSPLAGKFYQNSGACCYQLSDLYFSYSGGRDTADNRGDLNFIVNQEAFSLITTDDPKAAIAYLKARGKHD